MVLMRLEALIIRSLYTLNFRLANEKVKRCIEEHLPMPHNSVT